MRIPKKLSLEKIEAIFSKVNSNQSANFEISNEVQLRSILSTAAYVQLITTWMQNTDQGKLRLRVKDEYDTNFLSLAPETAIPMLLASSFEIVSGDDNPLPIDKESLLAQALQLFAPTGGTQLQGELFSADKPSFGKIPSKGPKALLVASDKHLDHGAPNWFYSGDPLQPALRTPDDLSGLCSEVLSSISKTARVRFGSWINGFSDDLGSLLYELFDNTHRWARHSPDNGPLEYLRGAIFDIRYDHPGDRQRLEDVAEDIPLILPFIRYHSTEGNYKNLGLLEISVFDGGPGLAAWELHKNGIKTPTISEETKAVIHCLEKWGTASGQQGRGLGLHRVLKVASERRGFVYIRTGRLRLHRDFANTPFLHDCEGPILELHKLTGLSGEDEVPAVAGTQVSIILPFSSTI